MLRQKQFILPKELDRFQPFTFFQFEGVTSKLVIGHFVNINHLYIKWYINAAEYLHSEFTHYYWQLIYLLNNGSDELKVAAVNTILERLRQVAPTDYKPAHGVNLTLEDF